MSGQPHRLLFVCSQNRLRSPTAERVFARWPNVEARSAGTDADASVPLSPELIAWADAIIVMEKSHKNRLGKKFRADIAGKRVVVLGIPDEYDFMQPELVQLLEARVPQVVRL